MTTKTIVATDATATVEAVRLWALTNCKFEVLGVKAATVAEAYAADPGQYNATVRAGEPGTKFSWFIIEFDLPEDVVLGPPAVAVTRM